MDAGYSLNAIQCTHILNMIQDDLATFPDRPIASRAANHRRLNRIRRVLQLVQSLGESGHRVEHERMVMLVVRCEPDEGLVFEQLNVDQRKCGDIFVVVFEIVVVQSEGVLCGGGESNKMSLD